MNFRHEISCDALVIGSGLAGLNFALQLNKLEPGLSILVVTKTQEPQESATRYAQGGIAAVHLEGDSTTSHIRDTINAGAGLCNETAVRECVQHGPGRIEDLVSYGVEFTKLENNTDYDLTREGGHSQRRIFHVADHTGRSIMDALLKASLSRKSISLLENVVAVDLITDKRIGKNATPKGPVCIGAYFYDDSIGEVFSVKSKVTFLATGGGSKVYKYTTNPDINSGDGIAMASRIGAFIANMEFIQFHPTCLFHPKAKSTLLSEALRGEGAILRNKDGEAFMEKYHPEKELAPRDTVSLSIDKEIKARGDKCVFLDISHKSKEFIREKFPHNYETCKRFGFDLTKEPVPVVPAAHYTCGGVVTDINGRTNILGLYAAGEVAHTGVHGANRLASNSLLEAIVFSEKAAQSAKRYCDKHKKLSSDLPSIPPWDSGFAKNGEEEIIISHCWDEIRTFMWNYVGIIRTNRRLEYAARRVELLQREIRQNYWDRRLSRNLIELRNLLSIAKLIVDSARLRKESRGLHQNTDYPERNDSLFQRDTIL